MAERVVLAYSGGLDTSVAISWIGKETGKEVVAVAIDLGQGGEDMEVVRQRALDCGAVESVVVDARDEFADEYCLPTIQANALYMDRYPLVSAISRPLIVKHIVEAARAHGGTVVSHGCTGKGNDQVRFEVGFGALAPDLEVIARPRLRVRVDPREGDRLRRGEQHPDQRHQAFAVLDRPERVGPRGGDGLPRGSVERPHQGRLRLHAGSDPQLEQPRRADHQLRGRQAGCDRRQARHRARGHPELNKRAGAQGVGRLDVVEDRLVGIKSREIYEAPGAMVLITAHQELEHVTLERELGRYKRQMEQRWSELVYDGLWFSPLKDALDSFVAKTQERVTGDIRLFLHGGAITVNGRRSPESLYDFNLATYDEGDTFDQSYAKGFVNIHACPPRSRRSATWVSRS